MENDVIVLSNDGQSKSPLLSPLHEQSETLLFSESAESGHPAAPAKRKARRTRQEIEHEKMVKEINRIRREMNAAKNSKCEQYLFCHVSSGILLMDDQIQPELRLRFTERSIAYQLIVDESTKTELTIVWKRKRVDAYIEDGKLYNTTTMGDFVAVLNAESFTSMLKSRSIWEFLKRTLDGHEPFTPQLTVLVLGRCGVRDSTLNDFLFEAYERLRIQFRFLKGATDFSYFVAQMHRAIAKSEKKSEQDSRELPVFAMQKGVRDGEHLVRDWWSRMLDHVHRMTEEQKRELLNRYPSPIDLMDVVMAAASAGDAIFQLANVHVSRNKCLGPALAQKLYALLTSWHGCEVIHLS